MSRIRTVKPDFWEDEEVGTLSRDARLLFIGTWNLADDEGLLRWTPAYIKASLFMYDDELKEARVARLMGELASRGLVFPYHGGTAKQQLACIVNFHKHQRINRPQPGKLPPPSLQNRAVVMMYARRDHWTCHLCAGSVSSDPTTWTNDKSKPSIDHVVPRSQGGDDYPSNVRLAHRACNSARGDSDLPFDVSEYVTASLLDSVNGSRPEGKGSGREVERKGVAAAARPRARDEIFETLCEVGGHGWDGLNTVERGRLNKARGLARESGATPEMIRQAADRWPAVMGDATMTALGVMSNFHRLLSGPSRDAGRPRDRALDIYRGAVEGRSRGSLPG
jgi:HNH endonuclease